MNYSTARSAIILLLSVVICVSCATRPKVGNYQRSTTVCTVYGKAFCDDAMLGKRLVVLPSWEPNNTLEYDRIAKLFKKALAIKGYKIVEENDDADVVAFFGYGTGEPKERTWVTSAPIYGVTGGGQATVNSVSTLYGSHYNAIGTAYSTQTIFSPLNFGVVGYDVKTHHATTYSHYATLTALDLNAFDKHKKMIEKWNAKVFYAGDITEVYAVAPWLALAAGRIAGKEMPLTEEIEMSSIDEDWIDLNGLRLVVVNNDPKARGVFRRYTSYSLNKKGNEIIEQTIEKALCESGLDKSDKAILNIDYNLNGKYLYIELKDTSTMAIVGADTEKNIKIWGADWYETARYILQVIAQRTMTDGE